MLDLVNLGSGVAMATTASSPRVLRFDNFELDVRAGELRKRGVKLRLRGQPLQVLAALLSRPGDVVSREELREQIWTADTFVDFDHGLHNAIARLRDVLGDSAETPRYIETLPRRGYRFIGQVDIGQIDAAEVQPLAPVVAQQAPPSELPVSPTHTRYLKFLGAAILTVLFLGFAFWLVRVSSRPSSSAPRLNSIAVLPLANLSGDPSEEFFADGMTDQLITDLAKIGSLRVVSRTSVFQYKGTTKSLSEIARELNVDAIVEGSVVRSAGRVRVTAQLLQARTDRHLWAETYERDASDVLKLQGEVTDAIAEQVRAQLTPQQRPQLPPAHAVDPAVYDDYLRGRFYFATEFNKPDSLKKAQQLYEESIQSDPNFALGYAGLADIYAFSALAGVLQRDQGYRSASEAVAKALKLDDSVGEAHTTLAWLKWQFDWDWEAADREYNRAIALAPTYSCAHEERAIFLAVLGRRDEALAEIAKIDQLDFSLGGASSELWVYYPLRDYPRLIDASKRALLLDPNEWSLHYFLGVGYEGTGKLQEAIPEYQKAIEISGGNPKSTVALAHAYSAVGKKAEAEKILHDLERKLKGAPDSSYTMATIYAGLGENDRAFDFLEKAYSEKSLDMVYLTSDLAFDSLRSDPRFQDLLHRMGLKK